MAVARGRIAEMWGFLSKADTGMDVFVRWGGGLGLMIGGYTWLVSKLPWFGEFGLAEMIAIAIPATLFTLLAVTASLAFYRYFQPLSAASSAPATPERPDLVSGAYDDRPIRSDLSKITERFGIEIGRLDHELRRLSAYAQIKRLGVAKNEIEQLAAEIQERLEAHQRAYAKPRPPGLADGWNIAMQALPEFLRRAQKRIETATGLHVDLTKHPGYTLNPMRPVPGDAQVENDSLRQDYRRTYDQGRVALQTVEAIRAKIAGKLAATSAAAARSELPLFGKDEFNG